MTAGVYVYGVIPAGATSTSDELGVGDPPGAVRTIVAGDVAALVSDVDIDQPLGRPADLEAHARVLDRTAASHAVLPLRFGSVLIDADAVRQELLDPNASMFASALEELDGHAQYLLSGQYVEDAVLREIVAENPDARDLLAQLRSEPDVTNGELRMALGELIVESLAVKREDDTARMVGALNRFGQLSVRDAIAEKEAFRIAVLARVKDEPELERVAGELADDWLGRITVQLVGPLAPYDFAVTSEET